MIVVLLAVAAVGIFAFVCVYASWESRTDRSKQQREQTRQFLERCDVCFALPREWFRVVGPDGETIWDGGCRECAHNISYRVPGSMVVPEGTIHHFYNPVS